MKTAGQRLYEQSVEAVPLYHDGTPRKTWDELGDVEKSSWETIVVVQAKLDKTKEE